MIVAENQELKSKMSIVKTKRMRLLKSLEHVNKEVLLDFTYYKNGSYIIFIHLGE